MKSLQAQPSKHIKAVVVLTDGQDNYRQMSLDQLVSQITPSGDDKNAGEGVKVCTIAYGNDADAAPLAASNIPAIRKIFARCTSRSASFSDGIAIEQVHSGAADEEKKQALPYEAEGRRGGISR